MGGRDRKVPPFSFGLDGFVSKLEAAMMIPNLETERLILKPLCREDIDAIQQVFPQWEIVRWLDARVPWPYPEDGARSFIEQVVLPTAKAGTGWHWSIRRRADPATLIGEITLQDDPRNNRGFWIVPEWQRHGYAGEAADAVTQFWFEVLSKPVLHVPKATANVASRRISERQGMRVIEVFKGQLVGGEYDFELWELLREVWLARRQ